MRRVKVVTPAGKGHEVAEIAFRVGIETVSIQQVQLLHPNQPPEVKDRIDVEVSTPMAKAFVEAVMGMPNFDPKVYPVTVRGALAIISDQQPSDLTVPVVRSTVDIFQDLWQFSHITMSYVTRVLIAAALLGYGMLRGNLLMMIAGLLFIPSLPLLLSVAFGLRTRDWRLLARGAATFGVGVVIAVAGGVIAALLTSGPMRFQEFSTPLTSFVVSLGVGVAAAVATSDDTGLREFIGLNVTAQTMLVPVWVGIALVRGFTSTAQQTSPTERLLAPFFSVAAFVAAAWVAYTILDVRRYPISRSAEGTVSPAD